MVCSCEISHTDLLRNCCSLLHSNYCTYDRQENTRENMEPTEGVRRDLLILLIVALTASWTTTGSCWRHGQKTKSGSHAGLVGGSRLWIRFARYIWLDLDMINKVAKQKKTFYYAKVCSFFFCELLNKLSQAFKNNPNDTRKKYNFGWNIQNQWIQVRGWK